MECGGSALPTASDSPASRASSESGEMLAFAHIPTGATADKGFDIDGVKSRIVKPRKRARHPYLANAFRSEVEARATAQPTPPNLCNPIAAIDVLTARRRVYRLRTQHRSPTLSVEPVPSPPPLPACGPRAALLRRRPARGRNPYHGAERA